MRVFVSQYCIDSAGYNRSNNPIARAIQIKEGHFGAESFGVHVFETGSVYFGGKFRGCIDEAGQQLLMAWYSHMAPLPLYVDIF